ncbi:hypothetical protein PUN28_015392 [Cardiocondyla obscurior]|uniref:Ribosomal protein L2 n=1 Tax=Cardiocondyla obscurior TaxID=286306 RepID=A0AAW2ESW7_9HYME
MPLRTPGSQIEGVAKWKLRRRYCLLSHREDPVGSLEHTFAYIVGPRLHSLVTSSCPLNNEFHIPNAPLGKLTTACLGSTILRGGGGLGKGIVHHRSNPRDRRSCIRAGHQRVSSPPASCIGGATLSQRLNSTTPLMLMQTGKLHV